MELINQNARQRGRSIEYREMLYGYHRVNPLHGADFILDLLLVYKKFQGKRKMTVPVRRHAYVQQMFLDVEFIEDDCFSLFSFSNMSAPRNAPLSIAGGIFDTIQRKIGFATTPNVENLVSASEDVIINFVLPLAGRFKTFLQFMHNFEDVCLKRNEQASLAVMLYRSEQDDRTDDMMSYINTLKQKYPNHRLAAVEMPGMFSRGVALQHGSTLYNADDLLFFIDVDMYMHHSTLQRIRINTVLGNQVYFPIVFSQYDPQFVCEKSNISCPLRTSPFQFDVQYGYWRQFGFGIVGMYNGDLKKVGGFDLEIKGWGKEDVDLLQKFINFNVTVFRAVDTGLVHIFHSIVCDPTLDPSQYQMCLGSKAASYASIEKLSNVVYKTPEIFHRNEPTDKLAVASE